MGCESIRTDGSDELINGADESSVGDEVDVVGCGGHLLRGMIH